MKESRTVLILATMYITALIGAQFVDMVEYGCYVVGSGWGQRFILGCLSWYTVFSSKVKNKYFYVPLATILYTSMCVIIAVFAVLGIVWMEV